MTPSAARFRLFTAAALALAACASCGGGSAPATAAGSTASSSSGAPRHCPGEASSGPVELSPPVKGQVTGIAVDETDVYWIESIALTTIDVFSCGVCGCDKKPKLLATLEVPELNQPGSIAVDETSVYFAIQNQNVTSAASPDGAIMKCAKTGCGDKPTVVASAQAPFAIALDATRVYWANEAGVNVQGGTVMKCAKEGCDDLPTVITVGPDVPQGIAVDATNVYWTSETGVLECPIEGCLKPTKLATFTDPPSGNTISIALDGSNVYFTLDNTKNDDRVMSCAITGCSGHPATFASKQSAPGGLFPGGLAVDEENVYWTNATQLGYGGDGLLMKCAKGGCSGAPAVIASHIDNPGPIAVDATSVYTKNHYTTIMKVPK